MSFDLSCDIGLTCTAGIPWHEGRPVLHLAFSLRPEGCYTLEGKLDHLEKSLKIVLDGLYRKFEGENLNVFAYEDNGQGAKRAKYRNVALNQRAVEVVRGFFKKRAAKMMKVSTGADCKQEAAIVAKKYGFKGNEHQRDALLVGYLAGFDGKAKD